MSIATNQSITPGTVRVTLTRSEAAQLTGLCDKTLQRFADAGEPVGRLKIGDRVLYLRDQLIRWLTSKATTPAV